MKILILGCLNLSIKRIIPALYKNFKKVEFEICSISKSKKNVGEKKWFRNYKTALYQSNADIVYISLQNSLHFYWAKKLLEFTELFHHLMIKNLKFLFIITNKIRI